MQFAAIDFETASGAMSSACSLGIAVVDNGEIVGRREWLIRPRPSYFSRVNIAVHGITPEQVAGEPEFDAIWPEVERMIGSRTLVAHNAAFDMGVLRACWRLFDLWCEKRSFLCSVALARRCWPEFPSHSLGKLADQFGIRFQHHNAEEDAATAARVVLEAAELYSAESLEQLLERTQIRLGEVSPGAYRSCRRVSPPRKSRKLTYVSLTEAPEE